MHQQIDIPWVEKDYSYIDYLEKANNYNNDRKKEVAILNALREEKVRRDYHLSSLKQINHAIQFDQTPNLDLKEVRSEIFKITINFAPISEMI